MTTISEAAAVQSQKSAAIGDAVNTLDNYQEITFQAYSRTVLPLDGYVYWTPTVTVKVFGSLHYGQSIEQNEDEVVGIADILFTTQQQVTEFSSSNDTLYLATVETENGRFRYSFSRHQSYFDDENTWHYVGKSFYPAFASQLLDRPGMIDPKRAVVSNSLPLWLALAAYKPLYRGFAPTVPLYPSFLVDPNLVPPYGAVHIEGPEPLQAVPYIDSSSSSTQLVADRVRITLYGLQSNESIDFMNAVLQYSKDTNNFGLMSMPAIVDGKRTQQELQAIAMQKTLELRVSYFQSRVNTVARQLILSAVPTVLIQS